MNVGENNGADLFIPSGKSFPGPQAMFFLFFSSPLLEIHGKIFATRAPSAQNGREVNSPTLR